MRLLVLVLLALSLTTSALAQDNTTGETNETGEPGAGNETGEPGTGNETGGEEAPAEPAGPITIVIEGHQEGSAVYFTDESGARNPTITVQPGQQVTFRFISVSGVHNLNIGGEVRTALLSDGEEATLEWTAPEEGGTIEYWCDPHRGQGMAGRIQVGAAPSSGGGGGEGGAITGQTIDLGTVNSQCAGQLAPAIVTAGVTGGPTLADYVERCLRGDQPVSTEREAHAADYVIPLSWALIGLGVVGVVWVHKYYKP